MQTNKRLIESLGSPSDYFNKSGPQSSKKKLKTGHQEVEIKPLPARKNPVPATTLSTHINKPGPTSSKKIQIVKIKPHHYSSTKKIKTISWSNNSTKKTKYTTNINLDGSGSK